MATQSPVSLSAQATIQSEKQDRRCDFKAAFGLIEAEMGGYKPKMHVTSSGETLKVQCKFASEETMHTIYFDCADVPCFNISIPEMMTTYIMAQLLKIAEAVEKNKIPEAKDVIEKAQINFSAKVVILQQMDDHFSRR